ncbi:hypothetical protein ACJX0J_018360, partial [Zea mays]
MSLIVAYSKDRHAQVCIRKITISIPCFKRAAYLHRCGSDVRQHSFGLLAVFDYLQHLGKR